jgi:hypothetical protein
LSKKDIIRCLNRYIAREVYHTIRADLASLQQSSDTDPDTRLNL